MQKGPQLKSTPDVPGQPAAAPVVYAAHFGDGIHPGLIEVALVDAKACAAIGSVSLSWWFDAVREGRAPKPVIRQLRLTRWKLIDIRQFWAELAETGSKTGDSDRLAALAQKASEKAAAKRNGAKAGSTGEVTA